MTIYFIFIIDYLSIYIFLDDNKESLKISNLEHENNTKTKNMASTSNHNGALVDAAPMTAISKAPAQPTPDSLKTAFKKRGHFDNMRKSALNTLNESVG